MPYISFLCLYILDHIRSSYGWPDGLFIQLLASAREGLVRLPSGRDQLATLFVVLELVPFLVSFDRWPPGPYEII